MLSWTEVIAIMIKGSRIDPIFYYSQNIDHAFIGVKMQTDANGKDKTFYYTHLQKKANSHVMLLPLNTCFSILVSGPVSYQGYESRVALASFSYSGPQLHTKKNALHFYSIFTTIINHIFLFKDIRRYHVSCDRMHQ